jgi:anti-sigma regulatory factor (Ser/Thr protein kinase)
MHEYMSTVRIWELTCPGLLEEVGRARRWTRDVLSDSPQADDAALIVTELSANALLHSDSGLSWNSFSLTLSRTPQAITITVKDSGGAPTRPHIQHPHRTALHGRGLAPGRSPGRPHGNPQRRTRPRGHRHAEQPQAEQRRMARDHRHHQGAPAVLRLVQSHRTTPLRHHSTVYWSEAVAVVPLVSTHWLGSRSATTPRLALLWLRSRAQDIADQLDAPAAAPVRHWLQDHQEQEKPLRLLAAGCPYTFTVFEDGTRYILTTRPTLGPTVNRSRRQRGQGRHRAQGH